LFVPEGIEPSVDRNKLQNDLEQMLRNPKAHFDTPEQILRDKGLSRETKRVILESWEQDAPDGHPCSMLGLNIGIACVVA